MIEQAKLLLGLQDTTEKDAVLALYLEMVEDDVASFEEVSEILKVQMLVERYQKAGSEHLQSFNYAGVSEQFWGGYSPAIQNKLRQLSIISGSKVMFL